MSHITRRKFLQDSTLAVGALALGPTISIVEAAAPLPPVPMDPYAALAEALVRPIIQEIREASIMRGIAAVERLRAQQVMPCENF